MLQNQYSLSDEAAVAEGIDSRAFAEFCGVESSNQVPDGDTLGRFRHSHFGGAGIVPIVLRGVQVRIIDVDHQTIWKAAHGLL